MKKVIPIFFLLFFFVSFSQNKEVAIIENELPITKDFHFKNANSYFVFHKDFDRNKTYKQILDLDQLKKFDKSAIDSTVSKDVQKKTL
jgi:hypothetical protein